MTNNTIIIPLSKTGKYAGQYEAIVSIEDSDLADLNWSVFQNRYAHRRITIDGKVYKARLHRVILSRKLGRELLPDELVDHIDGDGFNNVRPNLRPANYTQNSTNQRKAKTNTSGYKGVYWNKFAKKWHVQIRHNNKRIHVGYFADIDDANEAAMRKREELHGDFANHGK